MFNDIDEIIEKKLDLEHPEAKQNFKVMKLNTRI